MHRSDIFVSSPQWNFRTLGRHRQFADTLQSRWGLEGRLNAGDTCKPGYIDRKGRIAMAFVPFTGLIGVTGRTDVHHCRRQRHRSMRCRRNLAKPRDEIDDIWSELAEQMQTQGGTPDTDEWNNIIALAVAGGDLERAEYFLELMKKTGGTPNLASYNLIFSACQEPRSSKEKEVVYRLISQAVDDQMDLDELQMSSTLRSTVRSLLEGPQE